MYPGGCVVTSTYDGLERKQSISDQNGLVATYDYVGPHRIERREYGNGTRADFTYDGVTGVPNATNNFGVKRIARTEHIRISDGLVLDDRAYSWGRMGPKPNEQIFALAGLNASMTTNTIPSVA